MASSDPWADFESQRQSIRSHTVDRLKHIVTGLNEECLTALSKSGRKQDLIDRITHQLDLWKSQNIIDKWNKGRTVLNQVSEAGSYTAGSMSRMVFPGSSMAQNSHSMGVNTKPYGHLNTIAGSSSIARFDPYAPPRRPGPSNSSASASSSTPTIRFKPSPFIRVERAVSAIIECPESSSATDRRQQAVTFNLTSDYVAKLNCSSTKYQLRLFCTSSMFYSPSANSFRTNTAPCPIEFPPTCEVRVNNVQITANTKGLKKKPGTAPPADLGKAVRMTAQSQNRVELIYVNSQQPVQPKKFYMVVNLVEVTSVEELVEKVKKDKFKGCDQILATKRMAAISDDDDIVAGPQKMSLKCPLSYMRINTPCRSALCVHSQCFDATSWFSVMEQTTTYMCPVCEKVLNPDDLIVDGYFDGILKETPDSVEDVMVEADGQWHTSDNKYGSANWKMAHTPAMPKHASLSPRKSPPKPSTQFSGSDTADPNGRKKENVEIFVLDSDEEDEEGRVKRELSPSIGSGSSAAINRSMETTSLSAASQPQTDVIDLTLDSDEEDNEPSLQFRTGEKRKVSENDLPSPTEQIWKKSRMEPIPPPVTVMRNTNGYVNGVNASTGSSHVNGTISPSVLNAMPMPVHYDPLRDVHRAQSSAFSSHPPPRPPVTSPTLRFPNSTAHPFHTYLESNSPPSSHTRQPSNGGQLTPRGRDFMPFATGSSSSRWPQ